MSHCWAGIEAAAFGEGVHGRAERDRGCRASVLVACPELLRAECRTPPQLHLASAMSRFVEMSQSVVQ